MAGIDQLIRLGGYGDKSKAAETGSGLRGGEETLVVVRRSGPGVIEKRRSECSDATDKDPLLPILGNSSFFDSGLDWMDGILSSHRIARGNPDFVSVNARAWAGDSFKRRNGLLSVFRGQNARLFPMGRVVVTHLT